VWAQHSKPSAGLDGRSDPTWAYMSVCRVPCAVYRVPRAVGIRELEIGSKGLEVPPQNSPSFRHNRASAAPSRGDASSFAILTKCDAKSIPNLA